MKKKRVNSVKWLSAGGFIACQIRNNLDECNGAGAQYERFIAKIVCDLNEIADAGNVLLQERFS
ncbi:hypothetical protein ENT52713_06250 [Enterobacter sp. 200527-13]|nr:hypothetical protein NMCA_43360 [Enterobacter ludwigii]GLH23229.1 hypothetical protein ENT52713_06250 [Enterobacter sp. 200527-13]